MRRTTLYSLVAIALVALVTGGFLLSGEKLPPLAANSPTEKDGSEVAQAEQTTTEQDTDGNTEQEETVQETTEQETTEQSQDDQEAEQTAAEQAAVEQQAAAEQRAAERQAAEQAAAEQRVAEQQAAEQAAAEQRAAEQAAAEQAAAEQRAAEQAAAEQVAAEQAAQQQETAVQEAPAERQDGWRDTADHHQAAEQAAAREEPPAVETAAPTSTALSLTVPKMGLYNDPVTNSIAESVLAQGAGKIPSTGFPWQAGANTYIAAHVYGYPGTGSWQQFAALPSMAMGDAIYLTGSDGTTYEYRVTEILTVAPTDVWVAESTGQNMVSLQTCVGPGWSERLVVRAEMV